MNSANGESGHASGSGVFSAQDSIVGLNVRHTARSHGEEQMGASHEKPAM